MSEDIDILKDEEKEKLILEEGDFEVESPGKNGHICKRKSNDHWVGGMILIGSNDGSLYAFRPAAGESKR